MITVIYKQKERETEKEQLEISQIFYKEADLCSIEYVYSNGSLHCVPPASDDA